MHDQQYATLSPKDSIPNEPINVPVIHQTKLLPKRFYDIPLFYSDSLQGTISVGMDGITRIVASVITEDMANMYLALESTYDKLMTNYPNGNIGTKRVAVVGALPALYLNNKKYLIIPNQLIEIIGISAVGEIEVPLFREKVELMGGLSGSSNKIVIIVLVIFVFLLGFKLLHHVYKINKSS